MNVDIQYTRRSPWISTPIKSHPSIAPVRSVKLLSVYSSDQFVRQATSLDTNHQPRIGLLVLFTNIFPVVSSSVIAASQSVHAPIVIGEPRVGAAPR